MNWIICLSAFAVFALQVMEIAQLMADNPDGDFSVASGAMSQFVLQGWSVKGLFGYMWLHGGLVHLIGNLIFLWLFGNAVCSKLGNLLYLPVYIGLGVFAGIAHLILTGTGSVLGASGAINGIVGMYLIFFPENSISCFFLLLWYPIRFSISSYWMILFWFAFDILGLVFGGGGVAYDAHVGGFITGIAIAIIMLKTRLVVMQRDEKSLLELVGLDKRTSQTRVRGDRTHWQAEWQGKKAVSKASVEEAPDTIPFDSEQLGEQFVRFECECGQRVKVPAAHAGKMGRCPKCSKQVRIPSL